MLRRRASFSAEGGRLVSVVVFLLTRRLTSSALTQTQDLMMMILQESSVRAIDATRLELE